MTEPPERFQVSRYLAIPNAIGTEFPKELGAYAYQMRGAMIRGGDGKGRYNHELTNYDDTCPILGPLRERLVLAIDDAREACKVAPFELDYIEINCTLYHHGSFFHWHDDALGYDGEPFKSRRISYAYYFHSRPKRFEGGQLEFVDGTAIEPENGLLVMFNPYQQHRIRKVECYSASALDGRWALMGWLHGKTGE